MMHQPITILGQPRRRRAAPTDWCILRTSAGRTLALADSLADAGVEAWTPRRTFKRPKPGRCTLIDGKKPTAEIDAPILPTFVFVREPHAEAVAMMERDPACQHPAFSIMRHQGGKVPFVGAGQVAGLQQEERDAADLLERLREAESRDERRRLRAAAAANERERRKVLLSERRHFDRGAAVIVEADAFAGMTGIVDSCDGKHAMVRFSPTLTMKIEAWRLVSDRVQDAHSVDVAAK